MECVEMCQRLRSGRTPTPVWKGTTRAQFWLADRQWLPWHHIGPRRPITWSKILVTRMTNIKVPISAISVFSPTGWFFSSPISHTILNFCFRMFIRKIEFICQSLLIRLLTEIKNLEYNACIEDDDTKIWTNGILACINPGRCLLSILCPCVTTGLLAGRTKTTNSVGENTHFLLDTKSLFSRYVRCLYLHAILALYDLLPPWKGPRRQPNQWVWQLRRYNILRFNFFMKILQIACALTFVCRARWSKLWMSTIASQRQNGATVQNICRV